MANFQKLYLRDSFAHPGPWVQPTGLLGAWDFSSTTDIGTNAKRMIPQSGPDGNQANFNTAYTHPASATRTVSAGQWLSPPLAAQDIAAGNWEVGYVLSPNVSTSLTHGGVVSLYLVNGTTGAIRSTIFSFATIGSQGRASTALRTAYSAAVSGAAVTAQAGDFLVLEVGMTATRTTGSSVAVTLRVRAAGDDVINSDNAANTDAQSFINAPASLRSLDDYPLLSTDAFYFTSTSSAITVKPSGFLSSWSSGATANSGSNARFLSPNQPTIGPTTWSYTAPFTGSAGDYTRGIIQLLSLPLAAQTISAGNWGLMWSGQWASAGSGRSWRGVASLHVVNGATGAIRGTIFSLADVGSSRSSTAIRTCYELAVSGASVAAEHGDYLALEVGLVESLPGSFSATDMSVLGEGRNKITADSTSGSNPIAKMLAPADIYFASGALSIGATAVVDPAIATVTKTIDASSVVQGTFSAAAPSDAEVTTDIDWFSDNFNDDSINTDRWQSLSSFPTEASGKISFANGDNIITVEPYDFSSGKRIIFQNVSDALSVGESVVTYFFVGPIAAIFSGGYAGFSLTGPTLDFIYNDDSDHVVDSLSLASDYDDSRWWSLRWDDATEEIVGEYSPTGIEGSWTELGRIDKATVSAFVPWTLGYTHTVAYTLGSGTYSRDLDNYNNPPKEFTVTAPASGVVQGTFLASSPATGLVLGSFLTASASTGLVSGTFSNTSPATGLVNGTFLVSAPANAQVMATYLSSASATAVVQGTFLGQASVTALVLGTFIVSSPASADVYAEQDVTADATAVVSGSFLTTATSSGEVQGTFATSIDATAEVLATWRIFADTTGLTLGTFVATAPASADVGSAVTQEEISVTSSAVVVGSFTATADATAEVSGTFVCSTPATALVIGTFTATTQASAIVEGNYTQSAAATAVVQGSFTQSGPAEALVVGSFVQQSPSTAMVQGSFVTTANASVAVIGIYLNNIAASALVSGTFVNEISAEALVYLTGDNAIAASAIVQGTFALTTPAEALVLGNFVTTAPAATVTIGTFVQNSTATGLTQGTFQTEANASALVYQEHTLSVSATTVVVATLSVTAPAEGLVLLTGHLEFIGSGLVSGTFVASASSDAIVYATRVASAPSSTIVVKANQRHIQSRIALRLDTPRIEADVHVAGVAIGATFGIVQRSEMTAAVVAIGTVSGTARLGEVTSAAVALGRVSK